MVWSVGTCVAYPVSVLCPDWAHPTHPTQPQYLGYCTRNQVVSHTPFPPEILRTTVAGHVMHYHNVTINVKLAICGPLELYPIGVLGSRSILLYGHFRRMAE